MRLPAFLLTLLIILVGLPAAGGQAATVPLADYSVRLWQSEDGLPHNIVQAIAQSADGFLWVGTREGLARFDGVRFEVVDLAPEAPPASVLCLLAAKDGSLWVGTDQLGAFRWRGGKVERCAAPGEGFEYGVSELHEAGDGAIWMGSTLGVLRHAGGKVEVRAPFKSLRQSMTADPTGGIWLFGDGPLRRLDGSEVTNYALRTGTLPAAARRLYADPDGVFWIGSDDRLIRVRDGVVTSYFKASGPEGFVGVIFRDHAGALWVGSYAGLSRLVNEAFVNVGGPDEPSYRVYAIFEDREQNLWIGSEEGLSRLTPKRFRTLTKKDGLSLNTVVTVCPSRDGSMWISAWGGGLNRWRDGKLTYLTKADGLSSDFMMGITETRDGSLWMGSDYSSVLNRWKDGRNTIYGRAQGFGPTVVTALHEDERGTLWIGGRDFLQTWDGKEFRRYAAEDGFGQGHINALCRGALGTVWIGTALGLTRWRDGHFEDLAAANAKLQAMILSLYEDAAGTLWIGTKGRGLLRWQNGRVREFTTRDGLFSDAIYSILEDDQANLWLNSGRGIFRVEKKELNAGAESRDGRITSIPYGKADGILSSGQYRDVTQPAAAKSADGTLWFRTNQGVAVVNPAEIRTNQEPPPVVIEEVVANRQPARAVNGRIDIAPGRGELEIRYAGLSFRAPEKNQFRYQLEGVDPNWVEAGTRRLAVYNHLAPGSYRFRVTASNDDGVWNTEGASLELILRPYFWQTWWFLTLLGVGAVGAVMGVSRYVVHRRMRRKLERLEQQNALENERSRIARDMHDELGAKLTSISFHGATARRSLGDLETAERHITKMSEMARGLVLSLDQIVWAVDPENDSLENLANYICRYTSEFVENSALDCVFDIPPQLPPCRLSTELRHHIFLSVKEALNNVAKHARARRVTLSISARPRELEVSIADDGCGMEHVEHGSADRTKRTGHGLANLRERLALIRGRFVLETSPDAGTTVRLIVPLPVEE